jgi:hypothetical protein
MASAKATKAKVLALLLMEGSASGQIDQTQREIAGEKIKQIGNSNLVRLILLMSSNSVFLAMVSLLAKPLRAAFRTGVTFLRKLR